MSQYRVLGLLFKVSEENYVLTNNRQNPVQSGVKNTDSELKPFARSESAPAKRDSVQLGGTAPWPSAVVQTTWMLP